MSEDQLMDALCDSCSRMIAAEGAFKRALAAEGTPALRDTADGFFRVLTEMLDASNAVQGAVGERLREMQDKIGAQS